jgi:hypothetical protein
MIGPDAHQTVTGRHLQVSHFARNRGQPRTGPE